MVLRLLRTAKPVQSAMLCHIVCKDDRVIVLLVSRGVQQGGGALMEQCRQVADSDRVGIQFFSIATVEFSPALRVMTKPSAKFRTRGDTLAPRCQSCGVSSQAAGPESVDKDPATVAFSGRGIDAFDPEWGWDHHGPGSGFRFGDALLREPDILDMAGPHLVQSNMQNVVAHTWKQLF